MKQVFIYIFFNVQFTHITYSGPKLIHYHYLYMTNRPSICSLLSYVGVRVSKYNIDLIEHCHGHVITFLRLAKVT